MTMTFSRFSSRKDKALTGFQPTDAALLNEFTRAISCNATTGYVRVIGTAVYVPTFTADFRAMVHRAEIEFEDFEQEQIDNGQFGVGA